MTGSCFGERLGAGTVVHKRHKLLTVSTYLSYLTIMHLVEMLCHLQIFFWFLVQQ